jgi:hypothetical protein
MDGDPIQPPAVQELRERLKGSFQRRRICTCLRFAPSRTASMRGCSTRCFQVFEKRTPIYQALFDGSSSLGRTQHRSRPPRDPRASGWVRRALRWVQDPRGSDATLRTPGRGERPLVRGANGMTIGESDKRSGAYGSAKRVGIRFLPWIPLPLASPRSAPYKREVAGSNPAPPMLNQAAQATVDRFRSTDETKSRRPGLCHRLTKRVICGLRRIEPSNHTPSFTGEARLIRPPRGGSSSRLTPPRGACELEKTRPGSLHKAPGWGSRSHSPKRAKGAEPHLSQPLSSWSHRNARQPLGEGMQSLSDRRWSAGGSHGRRHGRRRCRRDGTGPSSLHTTTLRQQGARERERHQQKTPLHAPNVDAAC